MASMPISDTYRVLQESDFVDADHFTELPPSFMARGNPPIKFKSDVYQPRRVVAESSFFNPFKEPIEVATNFNQIDYLDLVRQIIFVLAETKTVVATCWMREIMRVEKAIREAREAINQTQTVGFEPRNTWVAVWDFETPQYDPNDKSYWQFTQWERIPLFS
ncbi:hypothetical protein F4678DRAFT_479867 [Xylaria arbuscula]|nr:hypothetical protein F4678DRAFT_479867 [Xylaria arbuscula]